MRSKWAVGNVVYASCVYLLPGYFGDEILVYRLASNGDVAEGLQSLHGTGSETKSFP
jgi:hypothetical protein